MKAFEFKIRELEALPQERRDAVLRQCFESGDFFRRRRKIRLICFVSTLAVAIALFNVFTRNGLVGGSSLLTGLLAVGTFVLCLLLMMMAQIWLEVRLISKFVRRILSEKPEA